MSEEYASDSISKWISIQGQEYTKSIYFKFLADLGICKFCENIQILKSMN